MSNLEDLEKQLAVLAFNLYKAELISTKNELLSKPSNLKLLDELRTAHDNLRKTIELLKSKPSSLRRS